MEETRLREKRMDMERLKKTGAVVLPSIFTIANMAFGFFSIISASERNYVLAGWFILMSYVMDMLDGRIARLVHGESSFGVEIDSLSDWMSFGIAPAYLMYNFVLKDYGFWGCPVAFLYILCGALRLARFNVKAHFGGSSKVYFQGLPIPAAAGILASFVLAYSMLEAQGSVRSIKVIMDQMPFIYGITPFIMIAGKPDFGNGIELPVVSNIFWVDMTVVVKNGHFCRMFMVQFPCSLGPQQKIFVHKFFHRI